MDKRRLLVGTAALVSTLAEPDPYGGIGSPEGILYAALMAQGWTLAEFQTVIGLLMRNGIVERSAPDCVTLTAKGREMARQVDVVMSRARA